MPALPHSPANIVQKLLIANGIGVAVGGTTPWQVFINSEPSSPDNVLTVYDTSGLGQGRIQWTGEAKEMYGFQVRIRAAKATDAWLKSSQVKAALEDILNQALAISPNTYLVKSIASIGNVINIGKEPNAPGRSLFTVNALLVVNQTT